MTCTISFLFFSICDGMIQVDKWQNSWLLLSLFVHSPYWSYLGCCMQRTCIAALVVVVVITLSFPFAVNSQQVSAVSGCYIEAGTYALRCWEVSPNLPGRFVQISGYCALRDDGGIAMRCLCLYAQFPSLLHADLHRCL